MRAGTSWLPLQLALWAAAAAGASAQAADPLSTEQPQSVVVVEPLAVTSETDVSDASHAAQSEEVTATGFLRGASSSSPQANRVRFGVGLGHAEIWENDGYPGSFGDVAAALSLEWARCFAIESHYVTLGPRVQFLNQGNMSAGLFGVTLGLSQPLTPDKTAVGNVRVPPFGIDLVLGVALVEDRRAPNGRGLLVGWEAGLRATLGAFVSESTAITVDIELSWILGADYNAYFLAGHVGYAGEWL